MDEVTLVDVALYCVAGVTLFVVLTALGGLYLDHHTKETPHG